MNKKEVRVRGFVNMQLLETGKDGKAKVIGETGWRQNTVTNHGLDNVCAGAAIGASGSKQVQRAVLCTQSTTVNATQVSLLGSSAAINTVSPSTVVTGKGKMTVSFHGSDHGNTMTIGSIGLFSTNNADTELIAGATFSTSQFASDQSVNATYQLEFS